MVLDTLLRLNFIGYLPSQESIQVIRRAYEKKLEDKKRHAAGEKQKGSHDRGWRYYWDKRARIEEQLEEGKDPNALLYAIHRGETGDAVVRQLAQLCRYKSERGEINPAVLGLFPQEGIETLDNFVEELSKANRENRDTFLDVAERIIFSRTGKLQRGDIAPVFSPSEYDVIQSVYEHVNDATDLDIDMRRIVDQFNPESIENLTEFETNMNLYWFRGAAGNIPLEGAIYRIKGIERIARKAAKRWVDLVKRYETYRREFEQLRKNLREKGETLDESQFRFIVNYSDLAITDMLGLSPILREGRRVQLSGLLSNLDLDWSIIKTRDPAADPTTRDTKRSKKLEQESKLFLDTKSGLFYDVHLTFLRGVILDKLGLEDPHHVYVQKVHEQYLDDDEFGGLYEALCSGFRQLLLKVEEPNLEERTRDLVIKQERRSMKILETREKHIRSLYDVSKDDVRAIAERGSKKRDSKFIIVPEDGGEKRFSLKGMRPAIKTAWEDLFESYLDELEQIIRQPIDEIFETDNVRTVYKGSREIYSLPYVEALEPLVSRIETYMLFSNKHFGKRSRFDGKRNEIRKRLRDLAKLAECDGDILAKRRELIALMSKPEDFQIDKVSKKIEGLVETETKLRQRRKYDWSYNARYMESRLYCLRTTLDCYTDLLSLLDKDKLGQQEQSLLASAEELRNRLLEFYGGSGLNKTVSYRQRSRYTASIANFDSVYSDLQKGIRGKKKS